MQSTRYYNRAAHEFKRCVIRDWQLYVFLLLPVAYMVIFKYVPMTGIQLAFKEFSYASGIWNSPWVGIRQFSRFINSYQFERVVMNTLTLSLTSLIVSFPIPILFALMINALKARRYKKVVQTIVNLPHFISIVILIGMLNQVFNSRTGIYGIAMLAMTGEYPTDLFSSTNNFVHFYIWSGVWQSFGWSSITYVAALTNVNPELHEAAEIDGASRVSRVIHIDIPAILPTITIMLILSTGSIMSMGFEKVYLLQNGMNLAKSEVISTYVYKVGLTGASDFSYSTAISLFNSVVNLAIITLANWISRRVSETSLW